MQQAAALASPSSDLTLPADAAGAHGPVMNARWVASGVRSRVLVPLGIALVLVIVVLAVLVTVARVKRSDEDAAHLASQVKAMVEDRTQDGFQTMQTLLEVLMKDRALQAAMRAGDRQALLAATAPLLPGLRQRHGITHLYFHRPDRSVLLRTHQPAKFDDRIDRFVLREAQRTGKPSWGNEQGAYGSYAVRVAAPWVVDGQLIGYTEMGIEFEAMVMDVRPMVDADVFIVLDKRMFDPVKWRSARAGRADPVAWDEFPHALLIGRSTRALPPPLRDFVARLEGPVDTSFEVRWHGHYAHLIATPLRNVHRQQVGELIVLQDITPRALDRRNAIAAVIFTIGLIGGALMIMFYVLLGRVQDDVAQRTKRLKQAQEVLVREQAERVRAERELQLQQERNQLLEVRGRMVEQLAEAKRVAEAALRQNEEVTATLRQTQSELVAAAREAGRAEIATNVLHNVGNVLNSVNVSATVIGSTLRHSRLAGLAKGMRMLADHGHELGAFLAQDEKGRKLPAYLQAATQAIDGEHASMGEELGRLVKSIDHIKDIVATQQEHAARGSVLEPAFPTELADDALRMQGSSLARHQVAVVREYESLPALPLDRGRVLQILVNLISNAKAAMSTEAAAGQQLTLRVARVGERLQFVVQDQGEGIPAENLTRIFTHGFTTRRTGHGFGLHSSALAAREMGGSLTVASDGPGMGATFTLDLPVAAQG